MKSFQSIRTKILALCLILVLACPVYAGTALSTDRLVQCNSSGVISNNASITGVNLPVQFDTTGNYAATSADVAIYTGSTLVKELHGFNTTNLRVSLGSVTNYDYHATTPLVYEIKYRGHYIGIGEGFQAIIEAWKSTGLYFRVTRSAPNDNASIYKNGGENKVTFKDVEKNAWYYDAVSFIAVTDITDGIGNGNFGPEEKLTRGQFLVMVMKAYGIVPDENSADNFADAGNTYYTKYLSAGKRLCISKGLGNNLYAPDKEITRQEMFTLLYNTLKSIDKLPEGKTGNTLLEYKDSGKIAFWAREAMTLFVESGTISGSDGRLNPLDVTCRAEMAQVLYNMLSK